MFYKYQLFVIIECLLLLSAPRNNNDKRTEIKITLYSTFISFYILFIMLILKPPASWSLFPCMGFWFYVSLPVFENTLKEL